MERPLISTAAILFTMGTASWVQAQDPTPSLQVQTIGGVTYVSGGVGMEERQQLKAMAADDNLALSFALVNGHYLGGAEVTIKDHSGKQLLEASADNPLFFARVPAGQYIIQATVMGKTVTREVTIPARGQARISFVWVGSDHDGSMG